jgi:hypothetical protein
VDRGQGWRSQCTRKADEALTIKKQRDHDLKPWSRPPLSTLPAGSSLPTHHLARWTLGQWLAANTRRSGMGTKATHEKPGAVWRRRAPGHAALRGARETAARSKPQTSCWRLCGIGEEFLPHLHGGFVHQGNVAPTTGPKAPEVGVTCSRYPPAAGRLRPWRTKGMTEGSTSTPIALTSNQHRAPVGSSARSEE